MSKLVMDRYLSYCASEGLNLGNLKSLEDSIDKSRGVRDVSKAVYARVVSLLNLSTERSVFPIVHSMGDIELAVYESHLPDDVFDAYLSVKVCGRSVTLSYDKGNLIEMRTRDGEDILSYFDSNTSIDSIRFCEKLVAGGYVKIKGILASLTSESEFARPRPEMNSYGSNLEYYESLCFVAYDIVHKDINCATVEDLYDYLEEIGYQVPLSTVVQNLSRDTFMQELPDIVEDLQAQLDTYDYATNGVVFELNEKSEDRNGPRGIILRLKGWGLDIYEGVVQTVLWKQGLQVLEPYAIIAEEADCLQFKEADALPCVMDLEDLENYKSEEVGIMCREKRVKLVSLYSPSMIAILDVFPGSKLRFVVDEYFGAVPCDQESKPNIGFLTKMYLMGEKSGCKK